MPDSPRPDDLIDPEDVNSPPSSDDNTRSSDPNDEIPVPIAMSADESEHQADRGETDALAHHQSKHRRARRAERHAHANLVGTLRHAIGDYAIDPDAGQQQSKRREPGEKRRGEPAAGDRPSDYLFH